MEVYGNNTSYFRVFFGMISPPGFGQSEWPKRTQTWAIECQGRSLGLLGTRTES